METFFQKYSYDFRHYSEAHIRRRIMNRMRTSGLENVSQMESRLLTDEEAYSVAIIGREGIIFGLLYIKL